jgi:hypothetical protein
MIPKQIGIKATLDAACSSISGSGFSCSCCDDCLIDKKVFPELVPDQLQLI